MMSNPAWAYDDQTDTSTLVAQAGGLHAIVKVGAYTGRTAVFIMNGDRQLLARRADSIDDGRAIAEVELAKLVAAADLSPEKSWYRVSWRKRSGSGFSRRGTETLVQAADYGELKAITDGWSGRVDGYKLARIHTCSVCRVSGPWGATWGWYGSIRDLDDEKPIVKLCSEACQVEAKRLKLVPADASFLDEGAGG